MPCLPTRRYSWAFSSLCQYQVILFFYVVQGACERADYIPLHSIGFLTNHGVLRQERSRERLVCPVTRALRPLIDEEYREPGGRSCEQGRPRKDIVCSFPRAVPGLPVRRAASTLTSIPGLPASLLHAPNTPVQNEALPGPSSSSSRGLWGHEL